MQPRQTALTLYTVDEIDTENEQPTALDSAWLSKIRQQRSERRDQLHDFFGNLYDPNVGSQDKERWNWEWQRQYDLWLAQQKSPHTNQAYSRSVREWFAYLNEVHAIKYPWLIEVEHVIGWMRSMAEDGAIFTAAPKPLAVNTINQRLAAVSAYYTHIESVTKMVDGQQVALFITGDGHPRRNPFLSAAVKRPEVGAYVGVKPVPTSAMQWILKTLGQVEEKTLAQHRDFALLMFFYRTGYRADSVLRIRWGEISEATDGQGAVLDWVGKRNKRKKKKLPPRVYNAMIAYLKADGRFAPGMAHHIQPDDYVWRPVCLHGLANFGVLTLDENRHITPSSATEVLRRHLRRYYVHLYRQRGYSVAAASAEAAISAGKYHLHSLRHTFATELSKASGKNILLVQELLDHESADTTRTYIEAIEEPEDEATELLERQFGL